MTSPSWDREAHLRELSTCAPGPPLNARIGRRRTPIHRQLAHVTRKGLPRWRPAMRRPDRTDEETQALIGLLLTIVAVIAVFALLRVGITMLG